MSWTHPTGNTPQAVHIVCAGYTQRDFHAVMGVYNSPVPTDIEVWTLNKALRSVKSHFGFVLDDLIGEYNKDPTYIRDIRRLGLPIITTTVDQPVLDMVNSGEGSQSTFLEFPILELRNKLGDVFGTMYKGQGKYSERERNLMGRDLLYLKNSFPMMLAYAWFIGVKTIFVYGADYTHPAGQRREDDQPNAEFWVGFCRGQGIQVVLTGDTTLCSTRDGKELYGYGARQPALVYHVD